MTSQNCCIKYVFEEHWVGDRNANAPKMGIKIIGLFLRKNYIRPLKGEMTTVALKVFMYPL